MDTAQRAARPRYGFYDYRADAPFAAAHPCDPAALARRDTDEKYRSGAITLADLLAGGGTPAAVKLPDGCGRKKPSLVETTPEVPSPVPPGPSASPSPAPSPAPAPAAPPPDACRGKTVFIQIYGPQQRDEARAWREKWRPLGASVPPIEDVYARAREANRGRPTPVTVTTVRHHDDASRACAQALRTAVDKPDWRIEPLSGRLKATPGTLEVWVAPPPKD
jgi:hypothetical protein